MAVIPQPLYKHFIQTVLMERLYAPTHEIENREVVEFCTRNALLMEYRHKSFAFNGHYYTADDPPDPPVRQRLHSSLEADLCRHQQEFGYELTMEKARVRGYITSMLALTPRPGDYLLLLPASLHGVITTHTNCNDWSAGLSPEKIADFQAKHESTLQALKVRLATNLII